MRVPRGRRSAWGAALVCLTGVCGMLTGAACESSTPRRPDIVLISIDCLNGRQFREGTKDGRLEHLTALAERGRTYTRAYSHAPWTTPAHMSMLTGLYPRQHGRDVPYQEMWKYRREYDRVPTFRTVADHLSDAGYETIAFVGEGSTSAAFGLGQGFERYEEFTRDDRHRDLPASTAALGRWLEERDDRPFFLFFHTYDFHAPLPLDHPDNDSALRYIDGHVGRVLEALRADGREPVILLTGDHGSSMIRTEEQCCYHGAGHYDENLRVPLVIDAPGRDTTGRSDALVRHVDLLPTILELAGVETAGLDVMGTSLVDVGPGHPGSRHSISEADARCAIRMAVATHRYKYVYTVPGPVADGYRLREGFMADCPKVCRRLPREQLFDLTSDPLELKNLIDHTGRTTVDEIDDLRTTLAAHLATRPRYYRRIVTLRESAGIATDSSSLEEALRGLGYIE